MWTTGGQQCNSLLKLWSNQLWKLLFHLYLMLFLNSVFHFFPASFSTSPYHFLAFLHSNWPSLSSVQFSCSIVSDSLWPHVSQHARPPCPSPTPRVHSDSHPSRQWCHPAISSSVVPFSCPQALPASGSFPMSQLFAWGGQSTGVSALA